MGPIYNSSKFKEWTSLPTKTRHQTIAARYSLQERLLHPSVGILECTIVFRECWHKKSCNHQLLYGSSMALINPHNVYHPIVPIVTVYLFILSFAWVTFVTITKWRRLLPSVCQSWWVLYKQHQTLLKAAWAALWLTKPPHPIIRVTVLGNQKVFRKLVGWLR